MAVLYPRRHWQDGDVFTPHELNAEANRAAELLNGRLDRENLGTRLITGAKVQQDVFHGIAYERLVGPAAITITRAAHSQGLPWVEVSALGLTLASLGGWVELRLSLAIEISATILSASRLDMQSWAMGIKVDGSVVTYTDPTLMSRGDYAGLGKDSLGIVYGMFLGRGAHTYVPVVRLIGAQQVSSTDTFDVDYGRFMVRDVRR